MNIKKLTLLGYAFIAGLVIFISVALYLVQNGLFEAVTEGDPLIPIFDIMVPAMAMTMVGIAFFLYPRLLKASTEARNFNVKVQRYTSAKILQLAMIEGPALFATVAYLITTKSFYVMLAAVMAGLMVYIRPSREGFIKDLGIGPDEEHLIE